MAINVSSIPQPALGGLVSFFMLGDPIHKIDDTIDFYGYGSYKIVGIAANSPTEGEYDGQLLFRYPNAPATIPIGTTALTRTESLQHGVKGYSATTPLDFTETSYQTLTLTGNVTFIARNHAPARSITVRVINNNSVAKNLIFPASWTFLGIKPTSLLGSKTGVLSLTCFAGSTGDPAVLASDADVVAVWASQL